METGRLKTVFVFLISESIFRPLKDVAYKTQEENDLHN